MTANKKLKFSNYVQIYIAAGKIRSYGDNLKYEENLKYEDGLKQKDNINYKDDLKYDLIHKREQKYEDHLKY